MTSFYDNTVLSSYYVLSLFISLLGVIDGCALARVGFCYTLLNGIVHREIFRVTSPMVQPNAPGTMLKYGSCDTIDLSALTARVQFIF